MKIPKRTEYLANYLLSGIGSSKNTIAPTLIKGPEGCGKSWITYLICSDLEKQNSTILPVQVPYQLSGKNLVKNINRSIELGEQALAQKGESLGDIRKRRVVLFVDRIDRLFNLTGKEKTPEKPKKVMGRAASNISQIMHAAELRSYLIERRERVSIICTSELDTRFMDDADLPFFNFFNVIEVKALSPDESREFLVSNFSENKKGLELFQLLESFSVHTIDTLTEGLIANINLLSSSLNECLESHKKNRMEIKLIEKMLAGYFNKISPAVEGKISQMSYSERVLIDEVIRLPGQFRLRDLSASDRKVSKLISSLREKGFLEPSLPTGTLYYKMTSSMLRSWLRYKVFRKPEEAFK